MSEFTLCLDSGDRALREGRYADAEQALTAALALDPRSVVPDFGVALGSRERARLETDGGEPLLWLAIVRVDEHALTANLRAPVVINPRRMIGLQIVGADTSYPDAYPLGAI